MQDFLRPSVIVPLTILIFSILGSFLLLGCSSVKIERERVVAPFDGERFDNLEPFQDKSLFKFLRWRLSDMSASVSWPEWLETKVFKPLIDRTENELIVTVINHATVLVQTDGLNILTDPIYSKRASPVSFAGPARVRKPGILFEDLPKIDVVVVSHDHYDHLDLKTLKMLSDRDRPKIFVGLGNRQLLESEGIENVFEVDWWEENQIGGVNIVFVPAQHWSARGLFDKRKTLWGGFFINGRRKVYFAGDTGWGKFFEIIKAKMGSPDVALVPIGAYEPRWFMKPAHINPAESVRAVEVLQAKLSIGIHFGTFKLTDEGIDQPIIDLKKAIMESNYPKNRFIIPEFGQAYEIDTLLKEMQL